MRRLSVNILLFLTTLFLTSCHTKQQYSTKPTKSLINPDSDLLEANAVAYHLNDSLTSTYLEIKNENLLYKRPDTTSAFYAEVKISYKLLSEQNSRKILDSGSYMLRDRSAGEYVKNKSLFSQFKLKAFIGANYYLEIEIFDRNKKTKYTQGLNIYKLNAYSDQNFLITLNDSVAFKNNFLANDQVIVQFSNPAITQVTVDCFFKEFGPALPPFSTKSPDEITYKPDSVFIMSLSTNQFMLSMPKKGFYHIKTDPQSFLGITLYTYDATFPGVSNSDEMIDCTRYLMSKDEFENCKDALDKKNCIDNFWLELGGSNERARELLKRYYGRVKEANKNFSSYTQGWKSDRGMVFIVFGPPINTYKSKRDEIWVYGNEANPNSLRFVFNKTRNPFTDNDYVMERSQFYKDNWYTAVEYWREGLIYMNRGR
ncbi:GWxTD domain-containing protein [Aurantibacillus circumpalustris]|uniref:GWxTD domain-containing protein n=1 Tax=Aurantibacillus circumpalustris TaxID=3036359 RepID=UPI00295AC8A8|nr:GWxTD domain-containing protein [Aurantibacillus circumpalustris]